MHAKSSPARLAAFALVAAFEIVAACSSSDRTPAQAEDAAPPPVDTSDASRDGRGPTGLDERVVLPDLGAPACTPWGASFSSCAFLEACRLATPDSGRCESCDGGCKGNLGQPCSRASDCDIIFTCFDYTCTYGCTLGSTECGRPDACLDVGAAPQGLCDPRTL